MKKKYYYYYYTYSGSLWGDSYSINLPHSKCIIFCLFVLTNCNEKNYFLWNIPLTVFILLFNFVLFVQFALFV